MIEWPTGVSKPSPKLIMLRCVEACGYKPYDSAIARTAAGIIVEHVYKPQKTRGRAGSQSTSWSELAEMANENRDTLFQAYFRGKDRPIAQLVARVVYDVLLDEKGAET